MPAEAPRGNRGCLAASVTAPCGVCPTGSYPTSNGCTTTGPRRTIYRSCCLAIRCGGRTRPVGTTAARREPRGPWP